MTLLQRSLMTLAVLASLALIYCLRTVIEPFLVAAFLAYLGNPAVERLQRWRLPRTLAVTVVFMLMLLLLILGIGLLIPLLEKQGALLIEKIPTLLSFISSVGLPWLNDTLNTLGLSHYLQADNLKGLVGQHWQQASGYLTSFWQHLAHSGFALFSWLVDLFLIPVVTFYLLRDWHSLLDNTESLLPRRMAPAIVRLLGQCDTVLGAFFKGQLMVMLALGTFYAAGLSLIGLQVGILIGLLAGLLSIVPYLGFSVGLITAIIAAGIQFHHGLSIIYVLIVFLVGNTVEGMVLTPWLVGDKIGLHPVAVIFAILAGGQLAGFIGILIALPVAAVLMVFIRALRHHYINGPWY